MSVLLSIVDIYLFGNDADIHSGAAVDDDDNDDDDEVDADADMDADYDIDIATAKWYQC